MTDYMNDMNHVIKIKVGEHLYTLDAHYLLTFADSTISKAVLFNRANGASDSWLDFSYRSPQMFDIILTLYQHGKLKVPPNTTYQDLKMELAFWGFDLEMPIVSTPSEFTLCMTNHVNQVVCPWGTAASSRGQTCWIPLACYMWRSLLASSQLINMAAVGFRDISVFMQHSFQTDDMGVTLMQSHKDFWEHLAELSNIRLTFLDGASALTIHDEARFQDLYFNNVFVISSWFYFKHYTLDASFYVKRNTITFTTKQCYQFEFELKGFTISITLDGHSVFWGCDIDIPSADPLYLPCLEGFILQVSVIHNHTLYKGFLLPTPVSRHHDLSFNVYNSQYYKTKPSGDWFKHLSKFECETAPCSLPISLIEKPYEPITILIEKAGPSVSYLQKVSAHTGQPKNTFYERINLSF